MKTIALFGGSFDPPHIGHETVVHELVQLSYIDKVIVMPTYLNPFKSQFYAPSELRFQWLQKMFRLDEKVIVSDYEILLKRKVSTIETLEYLLKEYAKVYIVIGADNLQTLKKWNNYKELQQKATFIVATRDGMKIPKEFIHLKIEQDVSSSQLRQQVDKKYLPLVCQKEIIQFYKEKNER